MGGLEKDINGDASRDDIMKLLPTIEQLFHKEGIDFIPQDFESMVEIMDQDGSGGVDLSEFVRGIVLMAEGVQPISIIELHCDLSFVKLQVQSCLNKILQNGEDIGSANTTLADLSQTMDVVERREEIPAQKILDGISAING